MCLCAMSSCLDYLRLKFAYFMASFITSHHSGVSRIWSDGGVTLSTGVGGVDVAAVNVCS